MAVGVVDHVAGSAMRAPRSRLAVGVLAFVAIAGPVTFIVPSTGDVLGVLGVFAANLTAGLTLYRNGGGLGGKEGRAWRLIGAGFLVSATGVLVVAFLNIVLTNVPAFGPPDLIFISGYAFIVVGLGSLPHASGSVTVRIRVWLDGLIGAVSLGVALWVVVLASLFADAIAESSIWHRVAGLGFPLMDVMALTMAMIVVVRRGSLRFDVRLLVLAAAIVAQTVGDVSFLSGVGENWDDAEPVFGFYLIAGTGYVLASLLVTHRPAPREYADRAATLLPMVAPYTSAVVMIGLLVTRFFHAELDGGTVVLLIATLLVGGLVVGRQAVAIQENRQLVEKERASLVSSISHELRTPLTAMMGFLEILDEEDAALGPEEQTEITGIVHQQAVYMSRIVADLIMLARGNPNEINLSEAPVRIRDVIDIAIDTVSDARGATDVSCAGGLVLYADGDRIQQVLVNLLANAVRYGGDYRAVVARVERDDIVIEVHDNGSGVLPRYALSIWERFERGPNRYNATNPGSGIGLAVVEAVARAHGGSAEYERSALLGGACFRVRLPARRILPPDRAEPIRAADDDSNAA